MHLLFVVKAVKQIFVGLHAHIFDNMPTHVQSLQESLHVSSGPQGEVLVLAAAGVLLARSPSV